MKKNCYRIQLYWWSKNHTARMKLNGRRKRDRRGAKVAIWNRNRWEKRRRVKRERRISNKIKTEEEEEGEGGRRRRRRKKKKKEEEERRKIKRERERALDLKLRVHHIVHWTEGHRMILLLSIFILYLLMHLCSSSFFYSLSCSLAFAFTCTIYWFIVNVIHSTHCTFHFNASMHDSLWILPFFSYSLWFTRPLELFLFLS